MSSPYLSIGDKRWLSRVSFGNLKVSKTKAKSVSVFEKLPDGSSRILQLQVPWTNTFGAQKQTFDDSKEKYSMTLIFPSGGEGDAELQKAVENLGDFENLMKGQAEQNSMDWFNKNGPVVGGLLKNAGAALAALAPGLTAGAALEIKVVSDFLGFVAKLPPGLAKPLAEVAGAMLILQKTGVVSVGIKFTGLAAGASGAGAAAGPLAAAREALDGAA